MEDIVVIKKEIWGVSRMQQIAIVVFRNQYVQIRGCFVVKLNPENMYAGKILKGVCVQIHITLKVVVET